MKMLIQACLTAALLGLASGVLASPTIELKDGSRIQGEIQGVKDGVYTVLSPSIGTLQIAQSNIVRIVYSGEISNAADSSGQSSSGQSSSAKSSAHDDTLTHEVQQLQKNLAQDAGTMQSIMSLESDPQIQAILNDPVIAKAIQEGDYASLLGNAKIQGLESNEHVKQLVHQQEP